MRKYLWLALAALLIVAIVAGCPRKKDEGDTTIDIRDNTPPAADSATPGDSTSSPDVNVDVNVESPDVTTTAEGGEATTPGDAAKPGEPAVTPPADSNVTKVVLETSKGNIVLAVHSDWSPLGAAHFLELVNAKYYDGAPWFRVFKAPSPNISVAQAGIAADPATTAKWQDQTIADEAVIKGNLRGTVAFGKSTAPNSRSTHIFVNLGDNSAALDPQGFSCFAEVVEGLDVADKLKETGDSAVDQGRLSAEGITYFKSVVPDGDTIIRAYVK